MYMTQGLHRSLQQRPNDIAVRFQGKGLTFAEYGARVARLAGALRALGVATGDHVAMYSLNSARYLEYFLAVPWAGAVLNPVNIRWSPAEILYSFDESETVVMIVDDTFKEAGAKVAAESRTLRHVIYAGDGDTPPGMLDYEALIAQSEPIEDAFRQGDDLAGIFYTGGTTGFPKGVMLSHANLIWAASCSLIAGAYSGEARYLHAMPMFHLADFAGFMALMISGGRHVVVPTVDPAAILTLISEEGITDILLAPTIIHMLLPWMDSHPEEVSKLDLSSLKLLSYGASPMTQALMGRLRQVFPSVGFMQGYGMTELAPMGTQLLPQHHSQVYVENGRIGSVGRAAATVEVRIVDKDGREVPRGTRGEIAVRGPNVMLGYWNKPEATAQAIRNGWMHTGDGGYMDDEGFVFLVDRLKDMIISGGENVYSAEVENALSSHPAVAQSAVIGIPHEKWGEAVHAIIVLRRGQSTSLESVQAHCRERIAGYKCPRSIEFREALPLSGVGKVLKYQLRESYWKK
ncbi:fatty-acid--CoA ligase [Cupriavidus necator]|uniref:Fatty-acid--CoA ligase n=1 Tax=Cupriavidus necator TaxID=106590 RepID=A0A1U9UPY3_CUPNE|nr:long-chain-fatty-acid--CoA ligase [Cupriavidus necator]AQV94703.1 fatty-acid--CoA ligase [Cupriavidus necator]